MFQPVKNFLLRKKNNMHKKINPILLRRSLKNNEWNFKLIENSKEESSLLFYRNFQMEGYLQKLLNSQGLFIMNSKIEYSISQLKLSIAVFDSNYQSNNLLNGISYNSKGKNLSSVLKNDLFATLKNYYNVQNIKIKIKNLNKSFEDKLIKFKKLKYEFKKEIGKLKSYESKVDYFNQKDLVKLSFIVICNKNSSRLLTRYLKYLIDNSKNKSNMRIFIQFKKILSILIKSKFSKISGIYMYISGRVNSSSRAKKRKIKIGNLPLQTIDSSVSYSKEAIHTNNGTLGFKVLICNKT